MKRTRLSWVTGIGLTVLGVVGVLSRRPYPFPEPQHLADRFLILVQAGQVAQAYTLTNQDAEVGSTLAIFENGIRHQFAIERFPDRRTVRLLGVTGDTRQTYGVRLRRWLRRRPLDPRDLSFDYDIGQLQLSIRVHRGQDARWRISQFQSHAA